MLNFVLTSQSIRKEKINDLIQELTPTHSIKRSFKNIDIIGFDVLDKNRKHLTPSKFKFYSGNQFYIVLYGKIKQTEGKTQTENKLGRCKAVLEYQKGGYFWSKRTAYLLGAKEIEDEFEAWEIGGIYKIRFEFEVPEFSSPGKYILRITRENSTHPGESILIFDAIKINIKRLKIPKIKITEDYNLSLDGSLLNPAVQSTKSITFPWTGNIEFYVDRDLRNFKKIIISARGSPALGIYPLLKVYVDKREIGNIYVNNEWNKYEFDLKLEKKGHILKVRFDNDGRGPGEERNMFVNLIKLVR